MSARKALFFDSVAPAPAPLVSVLIPTFARGEMLQRAVQSALNQNYSNIEVLVCDDAGPIPAATILEDFKDSRLRVVRRDSNCGVAVNVRLGALEANGQYLAIVNDDDYLDPRMVSSLVAPMLANDGCVVAFGDHWLVDESGNIRLQDSERNSERWGRRRLPRGVHQPFIKVALVDRSIPTVMTALIRRDAVDWSQLGPEAGPSYDLWIAYLLARDGRAAHYIPERLSSYRQHGGQDTATASRTLPSYVYCLRTFLTDPRLQDHHHALLAQTAMAERMLGLALIREGRGADGRSHLTAALRITRRPLTAAAILASFLPGRAYRLMTRAVRPMFGRCVA